MKINKTVKKTVAGGLVVGTVVSGAMYLKEVNAQEDAMHIVGNSTFNVNPEVNFELSINQYLHDCQWSSYTNSDGRIVSIKGKQRDVTKDHTYDIELNYLVDTEQGTYRFHSGYKDGVKMNELDELMIKIHAFDRAIPSLEEEN